MDIGVIVDLETTGLDPNTDKIIEIGLLGFVVDEQYNLSITHTYGGLEDPGIPLTEQISRITGLTDEVLAGRQINWQLVRSTLEEASIVIAHNSRFDSAFLRLRPELAGLENHWACSAKHIPWGKYGHQTRALNYLAADKGFVNPFAHRAVFDCATTFRLIQPHIRELIERSYETEYLVQATGAAFETKDTLRENGYRWDPGIRCWVKTVLGCDLESERQFLSDKVYKGEPRHAEITMEA